MNTNQTSSTGPRLLPYAVQAVATALLLSSCSEASTSALLPSENDGTKQVAEVILNIQSDTLIVGAALQLIATLSDSAGAVLSDRLIAWASSDADVASVNENGLVTGRGEGQATITATSEGVSGTSDIRVQPPPPPPRAAIEPPPVGSSNLLFDSRAGGAQDLGGGRGWNDLQAVTTTDQMLGEVFQGRHNDNPRMTLTPDFDGQGTHAVRVIHRQWTGECTNQGQGAPQFGFNFGADGPGPTPEIYLQWRWWMGRTPTGGGIGNIGEFRNVADQCSSGGRKLFFLHNGGRLAVAISRGGFAVSYISRDFGIDWDRFGVGFHAIDSSVNQEVVVTARIVASSTHGAPDGILQVWLNDSSLIDERDLPMSANDWRISDLYGPFLTPDLDMTEYMWDIVFWKP